jgi:predicted cupin superfamily sugar epimerase
LQQVTLGLDSRVVGWIIPTVAHETALCGCTVAPGFDFADWEMPRGEELAARHPEHAELFRQLSHSSA